MKTIIKICSISILILILLSGCDLLGDDSKSVSIEQRIAQFISDCNSADKSKMYLNLHPTETVNRPAMKDISTWTEFSDTYKPWVINETSRSGSTEIRIEGTIDNTSISPETITIELEEGEADVWYIKTFEWPDGGVDIQ